MKRSIGGALVALLVAAAPAVAQSPVERGYDEQLLVSGSQNNSSVLSRGYDETRGVIGTLPGDRGDTDSREFGADAQSASGSLPITGFDAGLLGVMGAALLGTGIVLRRTQRRPE